MSTPLVPPPDLTQTYEVFIRATPEKIWQALTDGAYTQKYYFGTAVKSKFQTNDAITFLFSNGKVAVDGVIITADPPRLLTHTWFNRYDAAAGRESSRVTFRIEPRGEATKVTLVHELQKAPLTAKQVGTEGWSLVLSGMKTLLETKSPLVVAPKE